MQETIKAPQTDLTYSIFHAMRAVLALEGKDFAKHTGVSAYFCKEYIKIGKFDIEFSDIIREAFDVRTDSDYDDFYVLAKEEVAEQIKNANIFLTGITEYLHGKS